MLFTTKKISISLRTKITALLVGTIAVSVFTHIFYGSALIVKDKASYIYQNNLSLIKAMGDSITRQAANGIGLLDFASRRNPHPQTLDQERQDFYSEQGQKLGVEQMAIFRHPKGGDIEVEALISGKKEEFLGLVKALPLPAAQSGNTIISVTNDHRLAMGKWIEGDGNLDYFSYAVIRPDRKILESAGEDAEIQVFDRNMNYLMSKGRILHKFTQEQEKEIKDTFTNRNLSTGVRRWKFDRDEYIVSYQKIADDSLIIVSLTPYQEAFAAASSLAYHSIVVGFCVLLVALGLCSILLKLLLARVKQIWLATQRVAEGDFSVRVDARATTNDELSDLANSFNTMAEKVNVLMQETADKVRMEKELETAQALQNGFFPQEYFQHENLKVHGKYFPSSECAGDWWGYTVVRNRIFLCVGDVTGHGVASALITAAAHALFHHIFSDALERNSEVTLQTLLEKLNSAVYAIGKGASTMSFIAIDFDLSTGTLRYINAAHPSPLYCRNRQDAGATADFAFTPLVSECFAPLGQNPRIELRESVSVLRPGEKVFLYTDGPFEPRKSDGKKISKRRFVQLISSALTRSDSKPACEHLLESVLTFFDESKRVVNDDITFVMAEVPDSANFTEGKTARG